MCLARSGVLRNCHVESDLRRYGDKTCSTTAALLGQVGGAADGLLEKGRSQNALELALPGDIVALERNGGKVVERAEAHVGLHGRVNVVIEQIDERGLGLGSPDGSAGLGARVLLADGLLGAWSCERHDC